VKAMFNGEMFRSVLTPREIDNNSRLDKLERQKQSGKSSSDLNTMERADAFGSKSLNTLSTFPSVLTFAYANLLSEENDIVLDLFCGHNSRASDFLSLHRKYVGFDVHQFPLDFTANACKDYPKENYTLHLQSSESVPYPDDYFDFAFTCPPYANIEPYNKIYQEEVSSDLSSFTYDKFLELYKKCISEGFRTLKPGKYFVIIIGDSHKAGKFLSLSNDTATIAQEVGFIFHDENIYNRKSNIGGDLNYKTFILTCKRFPTIHEYILIFKKPDNPSNPKPTPVNTALIKEVKPQPFKTLIHPINKTTCEDCKGNFKVAEYQGKYLCEGCRHCLKKMASLSEINFKGVL